MSVKILITGARAPAALELARAADALGWEVHLADSIATPLARVSRACKGFHVLPPPRQEPLAFGHAVAALVRREGFTHVLPTCEEVFYLSRYAGLLPEECVLLAPSFGLLEQLHDKGRFALEVATETGIAVPETHVVCSLDEVKPFLPEAGTWVAKPVFSRFGVETLVGPTAEKLAGIAVSGDVPWVIQRNIGGREVCCYAVVKGGEMLSIALYRPLYRAGPGAGIYFVAEEHAGIAAFVQDFAGLTGMTGQVSFDFMIDENDKAWVLECNPRATSGVHMTPQLGQVLEALVLGQKAPKNVLQSPRMLGMAMPVYALGRAVRQGKVREFWQDWRAAQDVVWRKGDAAPFWFQLVSFGVLMGRSLRTGQGMLALSTEDIEWNGTPLPEALVRLLEPEEVHDYACRDRDTERTRDYIGLFVNGSEAMMTNVHTQVKALAWGECLLPVSVNDGGEGENSYVCSPTTHYIRYSREELYKLGNRAVEMLCTGLLGMMEKLVTAGSLDRVVQVNNLLLSTNLYPDLGTEKLVEEVGEVTALLVGEYPEHALIWRSLNEKHYAPLMQALEKNGYAMVLSRQIYLTSKPEEVLNRRDNRKDAKVRQERGLEVVPHEALQKEDFERIRHLYDMLYVEKYSAYNPRFTETYLWACHEKGLLEFTALRDRTSGGLVGVIGYFYRNGIMTNPVLGYDTARPKEEGLYRILTNMLLEASARRGWSQNLSAGADGFKRSRGGEAELEFCAVKTAHLPWFRRFVWGLLALLLERVAMPLIRGVDA